jgi:hypothetical protein
MHILLGGAFPKRHRANCGVIAIIRKVPILGCHSRLLTHHSGGDHGGGEGLRQGFPSPAGCREELLDPPDLATATVAACSMFHGNEIRPLGFSRQGDFIGERALLEVGPAGLTMGWRGQGLGRAPLW